MARSLRWMEACSTVLLGDEGFVSGVVGVTFSVVRGHSSDARELTICVDGYDGVRRSDPLAEIITFKSTLCSTQNRGG